MHEQNPFFIHSSDLLGLVLVSQPLDGSNYLTWRRSMMLALDGKNKLGFVDGSVPQHFPNFRLWKRNDSIVASWILNSITKEISTSVIYSTSASAIWNDLENRFKKKNGPPIFQLKKALLHCTQYSSSVSAYFT